MANPQPCPFLKLSKEYLDAIRKVPLAPAERQILDTIMFHTWGNNPPRKEAVITIKNFMEENMIKFQPNVSMAIKGLLDKNMIVRTGGNPRKPVYSLQKDYEKWRLGKKNPYKPAPFKLYSNFTMENIDSKITMKKKKDIDIQDKKSLDSNFTMKTPESLDGVASQVDNEKKPVENENSLHSNFTMKEKKTPINRSREENVEFEKLDTASLFSDEKFQVIKNQGPEKEAKEKKPKKNNLDEEIPFDEIVDYLNEKTNSRYKPETEETRKLICARWNDGFRLDDFKIVIDVKTPQWLNNPEMSYCLRPQTLFGKKFEGYLNEGLRLKKPDKPQQDKRIPDDLSRFDDIL